MGQNQSPTLFTAASLLLFATAATQAEVPIVSQLTTAGNLLNVATVIGSVCCSPNRHCPDGPPVAGVRVRLVCNTADGRGNVTAGESLTGSNGAYLITVKNLTNTELGTVVPAVIGQKVPCLTVVVLPFSKASCSALSTTTGLLVNAPKVANVVVSLVIGVVGCLIDLDENGQLLDIDVADFFNFNRLI